MKLLSFLTIVLLSLELFAGSLRPWGDTPKYFGKANLSGTFTRPRFNASITQTIETEGKKYQRVYKLEDGVRFFTCSVVIFPGKNTFVAKNGLEEDTLEINTTPYPAYPLKVRLKWSGNNQDYDLKVNEIYYGAPNGEDGSLDHDWKRDGDPGGPIETISYAHAPAGAYRIFVKYYADHKGNGEGQEAVPTEVTVEWRGRVLYRGKRTLSKVGSIWPVGTLVIHAGHQIGGLAVDNPSGKGGICPHPLGAFRGIDPSYSPKYQYTSVKSPLSNRSRLFLDIGDAAQFYAYGTINLESKDVIPNVEMLNRFTVDHNNGGYFSDRLLGVYQNSGRGSGISNLELYRSSSEEDEHQTLANVKIHNVNWSHIILADYNRDGEIEVDETSEASDVAFEGDAIPIWINDGKSSGDYVDDAKDNTPGHTVYANYNDSKVNGRYDLINFTPICLNLYDVLQGLPPEDFVYKLHHADEAVGVVWTNLYRYRINEFYTDDDILCGKNLDTQSWEAPIERVTAQGITLPTAFLNEIKKSSSSGIIMLEGCKESTAPLRLSVYEKSSPTTPIFTYKLPLHVMPVETMYQTINIRSAIDHPGDAITIPPAPPYVVISKTTNKHIVFIHGYNVDEERSRGWAAEMFKRLYRAGSKARFSSIQWEGDKTQIIGTSITPNYYVNVINAFDSAPALTSVLTQLPGEKTILAHSLGNMLASSAVKAQPSLVKNYVMLNAALPAEAFNESSYAPEMIPSDWNGYLPKTYASNWHKLFTAENDGRKSLTWCNFFKPILDSGVTVYNFYSSSEDVLSHAPAGGDASLSDNVWAYQEQHKGRWQQYALPGRTACEGGWGKERSPLGTTISPEEANSMTDEKLILSPVFTHFESRFHATTNAVAITQAERFRILADGIPALSHAVGSTPTFAKENWDMHALLKWPEHGIDNEESEPRWRHSDIRALAYPFVYPVFDEFIRVLDLK